MWKKTKKEHKKKKKYLTEHLRCPPVSSSGKALRTGSPRSHWFPDASLAEFHQPDIAGNFAAGIKQFTSVHGYLRIIEVQSGLREMGDLLWL